MERSLHSKGKFSEVDTVIKEYLEMGHAETVPVSDLNKNPSDTYYMLVYTWSISSLAPPQRLELFDASAMSGLGTGVSLNDTLQVGPTVHSSLLDVLIRITKLLSLQM